MALKIKFRIQIPTDFKGINNHFTEEIDFHRFAKRVCPWYTIAYWRKLNKDEKAQFIEDMLCYWLDEKIEVDYERMD